MIRGGLQDRQEKGEELPRGAEKVAEEIAKMKGRTAKAEDDLAERLQKAEAELAELKRRIEVCRDLAPPKGIYDGASFGHGRNAVIRALTSQE